ncbi:unnamed protein product [Amaranthus hypochondriacus]
MRCVTPSDVASLLPCTGALHPPPNKRRSYWLPAVSLLTNELIKLPSDFATLFRKREGVDCIVTNSQVVFDLLLATVVVVDFGLRPRLDDGEKSPHFNEEDKDSGSKEVFEHNDQNNNDIESVQEDVCDWMDDGDKEEDDRISSGFVGKFWL